MNLHSIASAWREAMAAFARGDQASAVEWLAELHRLQAGHAPRIPPTIRPALPAIRRAA